ncbi:MAG: hypothetical protein ACU88J_07010 [Gammaproteobacteria bacterium]
MDNDTLIDQARHLYAALHVEQYALSIDNKTRFDRLDHMVIQAYCRYQRRLNRCVLCYQHRLNDCFREFLDERRRYCPAAVIHST